MEANDSSLADLAGAPVELANLVEYQADAIVSRTLVDDDAATITVFALDADQRISEHTAPHDALLQVLDGSGKVTVGEATHELAEGEGIVFPANEPHAVAAHSEFTMLLTMLR